jgi:hypothetical protein
MATVKESEMRDTDGIPLDMPTDRRKMQFQKSISLGNLLTIASIVGGLITVYSQFKADIAVMQANITQQREVDKQHELALQQLRLEIRDDIKDIKGDQRRISDTIERLTTASNGRIQR